MLNERFGETAPRYHIVDMPGHDVLHRSTWPRLTQVVGVRSERDDGGADGAYVRRLPRYSVYKANRNLG